MEAPSRHCKKRESEKVEWSLSIFAYPLKLAIDKLRRVLSRPKLELTYAFRPNSQGVPNAGEVHFLIKNSGRASAQGIVVNLIISKPQDIYPGRGLFFDETIGCLEHSDTANVMDMSKWHKPKKYRYRLKAGVFINPGADHAQMIFRTIVFAAEKTAPGELDHKIEWRISCSDIPSEEETIALQGVDLKRMLMTSLYESGRVIGYEVPSGKIPVDDSE
jgi:hypothetical protein